VRFKGFAELDLFGMALFVEEFGFDAKDLLGDGRGVMTFTCGAFASGKKDS
jgi:hypothetical protein